MGRIRTDIGDPTGRTLAMFCRGDQLLKGAPRRMLSRSPEALLSAIGGVTRAQHDTCETTKAPEMIRGPLDVLRKGSAFGGFFFLLGDFLAGFLIDHLHAKAHLARSSKPRSLTLTSWPSFRISFGWFSRLLRSG